MHFVVTDSQLSIMLFSVVHPGTIDELMDILFERYGHTTSLEIANEETPMNINGTWTGKIGLLQEEKADVSLLPQAYDEERALVIDYVHSGFGQTVTIFAKAKITSAVGDVAETFHKAEGTVWLLAIIILFVVVAINKNINLLLKTYATKDENDIKDNNLLTLFQLFLYQGSSRQPSYACTRILLQFFLFYELIFICYLYADLKTSFTIIKPKVFKTMKDLLDDPKVKIILADAGTLIYLFKDSILPVYKAFWKRLNTPPSKIIDQMQSGIRDMGEDVLDENTAFVGNVGAMHVIAEALCDFFKEDKFGLTLTLNDERLHGLSYAIPIRKDMEPEKAKYIHMIYRRVIETAAIKPILNKVLESKPQCVEEVEDSMQENEALLIDSLKTSFIWWAIGLGIATVCFLLEHCVYFLTKCLNFYSKRRK